MDAGLGQRVRAPETPLKLVVMAAVWFIAAAVAAMALSTALLAGLHLLLKISFDMRAFVMVLVPATQACLVLACLQRGRRVGNGNARAGNAWLPVRRRFDVALLTLGALLLSAAHVTLTLTVPAYRNFFGGGLTSLPMPDGGGTLSPLYIAWVLLAAIAGGPVSEELFFRGWLWVGLAQWWSIRTTAAATGLLWLLAHAGDGGWRRVLVLAPTMLLITVARALGGSVRASLAVHVAGNAAVGAVIVLGAAFGLR